MNLILYKFIFIDLKDADMISSLIPYTLKAIILSIIFCGLIIGYNYLFDSSFDPWWGVLPAILIPSFSSNKTKNISEDVKE